MPGRQERVDAGRAGPRCRRRRRRPGRCRGTRPRLSWPVDSASPKCSRGPGREALGVGDGDPGPAQAALPDAGQVAVAEEPDLAQLLEADADLHAPTPAGLRARAARTGTPKAQALAGALAAPGGRHGRGHDVLDAVARCRRRSRSRASSGSPRGRARRARPASPARGSPCGAPPRGGPTGAPRPRCGGGGSTSPCRGRARPWPPATGRGRKCSLHSWNVPPARHTCSITGPRRRSPRLTRPSIEARLGVVPLQLDAPGAAGRVAEQVDLAAQLLLGVHPEPLERV